MMAHSVPEVRHHDMPTADERPINGSAMLLFRSDYRPDGDAKSGYTCRKNTHHRVVSISSGAAIGDLDVVSLEI